MADSWLETSLHLVHDLALLSSACVAVIRLRTNGQQTCVIVYLDSINLGRGRDFGSRVAALIGKCTSKKHNERH